MDSIQRMAEAFSRRDVNAYLANYARDFAIENGDGKVTMAGQRAMREFYSRLFANSDRLHGEIVGQLRSGAYVVNEEVLTGIEMEGYPSDVHCLCVYRIDQGLIVHEWELM